MRVDSRLEHNALGDYARGFVQLVGEDRWFRRADQLDSEQRQSPFKWKVVRDYHWLEMAISQQYNIFAGEGRLRLEEGDPLTLSALTFAATAVEVHAGLSPVAQRNLEGRLRDGLKAETGFAALYLELDLAPRLMDAGFDVEFVDMEEAARFDLLFHRGAFVGEVECKSLSSDAGRQIHRKDFYRFMEALAPALETQRGLHRPEVLLVTLDRRLSSNTSDQGSLRTAAGALLVDPAGRASAGDGFELERRDFNAADFGASLMSEVAFYRACQERFGANVHVAGGLTQTGGCLVVMRSSRGDDTSKPMLDALRKASRQVSGERPAFIAVQMHGIKPADLMLPNIRRQAGILSYALFGHYQGSHVCATYFTGFGAVVEKQGTVGTPAFGISNPKPAFSVKAEDAAPFVSGISDEAYAAAIGAPLPASNISVIPISLEHGETEAEGEGS